ncbi:MAG TPA: hypothetical protein VHQ42_03565 [Candidatus Limnocylindria bacterium]|nr:hypothetical protein [Candidatus Limnocylindria bacterium]
MRTTLPTYLSAAAATPIRGVFYPDPAGGSPVAGRPMLPRLLAILGAVLLVRAFVAGRHGHAIGDVAGGMRRSRRREALATLHRELHAADDAPATDTEVTA